jgi:hypothetical protein
LVLASNGEQQRIDLHLDGKVCAGNKRQAQALKELTVWGGNNGMDGSETQVDFGAAAALRKWPSRNNQRRTEGTGPYLLFDGTLDECIREFMARPVAQRHLYEIHTSPQPPLVTTILSGEHVVELARLRDFL